MAPAFNALDYARQLEAAGVAKEQAEVHARALTSVLGDVVFARDLVKLEDNLRKEIRQSIDMLRVELTAKIDELKFSVNARIDKLDARIEKLDARIDKLEAELRAEIKSIKYELMLHRWLLGLLLAISTANTAMLFKMIAP